MIIGVGTDIVEVARFAQWHTYTYKQLLRIFSPPEIDYCLSVPAKSAERFAARFAAREACYKALASFLPIKIPFLTFCRAITITHTAIGAPHMTLLWECINVALATPVYIYISLSHTNAYATAVVVVEQ